MTEVEQIAVVGLGNPLMRDDGIGPRVVRELQKNGVPPGVRAVEAGGGMWGYWCLLQKCRQVIAVDSMQGGGPPGAVYLVTLEQLSTREDGRKAGPGGWINHDPHFLDVLQLAAHYGIKPQVTIIGVEPKEIGFSLELSPEIETRLPEVLKIVREQCRKRLH
ncbi:hydrogenase maturation protease [Desulfoscipio sp. XC116]|uniref:hydrogenase maturation protease n=1 Tax=Desulfoscipio sp. XC116 TaxID=3144975 RepID=UPI00325B0D1F